MSFRIFQNEKTLVQAIKTRSSKSRKIDIFPKGLLSHGFGPKMAFLTNFFFLPIQPKKMSFTLFQNKKTHFKSIKTKSSKRRKIDIFPNRLTRGFGPKMAVFPTFFFLASIEQDNVFYDILKRKNTFLGYKNKKFKTSKNSNFSKGVNPWFWFKKWPFFQLFFLCNIEQKKCLLRYSRTKKRISRL